MKKRGPSSHAVQKHCSELKLFRIAKLALLLVLIGTVQAFSLDNLSETSLSGGDDEITMQQLTVTGTVTDESGIPLPGVNVLVNGTTIGVITDRNGEYSIEVPSADAVLHFSYVGFVSQDISVSGNIRIDVVLVEGTQELDEVVITAYGTQQKRAVTGAQQTVLADELGDIPVPQIANKLQGKVSGVQINQTTGIPGQAPFIRIRNAGSINAGSDPLYVVDGFPIEGDLTGINPQEIESITILKDASSTALYGSRAANGVVLIETKSASTGSMQVSFSAYAGMQVLPAKRVEMMNGTEFAQFKQETYLDRGIPLADIPAEFQNPEQYGEGTDWYNIMMNPAPIQDYTLTLRGGTNRYRASVIAAISTRKGFSSIPGTNASHSFNSVQSHRLDGIRFQRGAFLCQELGPETGGAFWAGNLLYNALLAWPIVEYKNADGSLPLGAWIPGLDGFPTPNYYRAAQEIEQRRKSSHVIQCLYRIHR